MPEIIARIAVKILFCGGRRPPQKRLERKAGRMVAETKTWLLLKLFKLPVNRGKKLRVRLLQPCDVARFQVNAGGSVWIGIYRKSRKLKVLNGLVFLRGKANGGTQKFFG